MEIRLVRDDHSYGIELEGERIADLVPLGSEVHKLTVVDLIGSLLEVATEGFVQTNYSMSGPLTYGDRERMRHG